MCDGHWRIGSSPSPIRTVAESDVTELAGRLRQVWPTGGVPAKVAWVSVDVRLHNGVGMEHRRLPLT